MNHRIARFGLAIFAAFTYAWAAGVPADPPAGKPGEAASVPPASGPNGVVVLQSTNIGRGCVRCSATPVPVIPTPAPSPSIPAGFVVVQSNYLDQVAATAKSAIDSAKANEESLVGIMKVAGWVLAALIGVVTFFGYREYKSIRHIQKKLKNNLKESNQQLAQIDSLKNEVVPKLQASLAEVQDMETILIDLSFLHNVGREVDELHRKKSPDLVRTASEALSEGKRLFEHAEAHHNRRQTENGERILSYIAAVMGVISMRAQSLDEAIQWARHSVKYNPRGYDDRAFNLACALAQRFEKRKDAKDKAEALQILEDGFTNNTISWSEAWDDGDFNCLRESLKNSKFAIPETVQQFESSGKAP